MAELGHYDASERLAIRWDGWRFLVGTFKRVEGLDGRVRRDGDKIGMPGRYWPIGHEMTENGEVGPPFPASGGKRLTITYAANRAGKGPSRPAVALP